MRIIGAVVVAIGVVVNNYAFLHGGSTAGPARDVIVMGSPRMAIATSGVLLVTIGVFMLLGWARSISGHSHRS